jgi:signal peptidase
MDGLKIKHSSGKRRHIFSNVLLVFSLVVLVLAAILAILGRTSDIYIFGYKPFIITTGSMETDYMTYSTAIVKKGGYDKVKVGDVIAFRAPAIGGGLAFHRVVEITDQGFHTKGDYNKVIDSDIVTGDNYVGHEVWHTNLTAYYMQNLKGPWGIWRMVVAPLVSLILLIVAVWLLRRWDIATKEKALAISAFVLVTSVLTLLFYMYWSDRQAEYINTKLGESAQQFLARPEVEHTINGHKILGTVKIDKINIEYPIIKYHSDKSLDHTITLYAGPNLNQPGNVVLAGHHSRSNLFFTRIDKLAKGDTIEVTAADGQTLHYIVDDYYEVKPTDRSVLAQNTDGRHKLTLISCSRNASMRYIVSAVSEGEL